MELICTCSSYLSKKDELLLSKNHINIIHKARLSPLYIVEAEDIARVNLTGIFNTVRKSESMLLATDDVIFRPYISRRPLARKNRVGWDIKVAVFDSGIYPNEVLLSYEKNFTLHPQIITTHGTYVAKIIKHFSPGAQIMSFKVGHTREDIKEGNVIKALDEAYEENVNIINMSFGKARGCYGQCELCDYVDKIVNTGIVVVAAAGNDGQKNGYKINCPGSANKAITVGAINENGSGIYENSSIGCKEFNKPNLLAPGYAQVLYKRASSNRIHGTSIAAPIITGILASLFSCTDGNITKEEIITKLYETCQSIDLPKHYEGFGVINLEKLVKEVCCHDNSISSKSS